MHSDVAYFMAKSEPHTIGRNLIVNEKDGGTSLQPLAQGVHLTRSKIATDYNTACILYGPDEVLDRPWGKTP